MMSGWVRRDKCSSITTNYALMECTKGKNYTQEEQELCLLKALHYALHIKERRKEECAIIKITFYRAIISSQHMKCLLCLPLSFIHTNCSWTLNEKNCSKPKQIVCVRYYLLTIIVEYEVFPRSEKV